MRTYLPTSVARQPFAVSVSVTAPPTGVAAFGVLVVCGVESRFHEPDGTFTDSNAILISTVTTVVEVHPVMTASPAFQMIARPTSDTRNTADPAVAVRPVPTVASDSVSATA